MKDLRQKKSEKNFDLTCELQLALEVLGGKWKLPILYELCKNEVLRFKEIERRLPNVSPKMLVAALRELETDQLVQRKAYATIPPTVEYRLTPLGLQVQEIVKGLQAFGSAFAAREGE
jgi:DNA-binding HxlR family transcriptional regulator